MIKSLIQKQEKELITLTILHQKHKYGCKEIINGFVYPRNMKTNLWMRKK